MPKEFAKFDETMRLLIKVPHDEIKAALEQEKHAKAAKKKRKAKKLSADRATSGEN